MKKLFTFSACILFGTGSFAQNVYEGEVIARPDLGYHYSSGGEADFNNDGFLDMILAGRDRPDNVHTRIVLFDPDHKEFGEGNINQGINLVDRPHFVFADFNGDGIIDIVAAESGENRGSGIYQGNGDGTFTKINLTFSDDSYVFLPSSVDVGDFNNDGLIDIIAIGYGQKDGNYYSANAVLINKGNYHFEVTNRDLLGQYDVGLDIVKVLDFNNDGYMDFFVTGNLDNGTKDANDGARVIADVFLNTGESNPGKFTRMDVGNANTGVLKQKANGGFNFADFDNDGYLDIFIMGEGGEGTGEPAKDDWTIYSHVYLNKEGNRLEETDPVITMRNIFNGYTSYNTTRVMDWTGNGAYDIFVIGWDRDMGCQTGWVYKNNGTAEFEMERIPGTSEGIILLADYDGDGKRDYITVGYSGDETFFKTGEVQGRTMGIMLNENNYSRPDAPEEVAVGTNGNRIIISWTPAESALNNTSYEYFIQDVNTGKFYTSCLTHVGGELDGVRKVSQLGNAMLNKSITLHNIPEGEYLCGVQAINSAFEGSVFTTTTFRIGLAELTNVSTSDTDLILVGRWEEAIFETLYNENVTSIDFTAVHELTELPAVLANTNCMLYLNEDSELTLENANIVKGNTATTISISDEFPFNNTKEITVQSLSYFRDYSAGWYSLCLPFSGTVPTGLEILQFAGEEENTLTFAPVSQIIAHVPYIVSVENNIKVTFTSEGEVILPATNEMKAIDTTTDEGSYTLKGTFVELHENLVGKYLLNEDGSGFGIVTDADIESGYIPAFRAYIEYTGTNSQNAPSFLALGIDDGGTTKINEVDLTSGLLFSSSDGILEIYAAEAQAVKIYTLDGCLLKEIQLQEGANKVAGLNRGIYLVNNQKAVVK